MYIQRPKYLDRIYKAISDENIRLLFLTGPRDAGKTTLLKHIYDDQDISLKKHYYSFDQSIVSKQFHDTREFMNYFNIRFGIQFDQPGLLLLNEIQYSKDIVALLFRLCSDTSVKTKIIATSVSDPDISSYTERPEAKLRTSCVTIYSMDFYEFLEHKGIHTQYLTTATYSKILLQEIQPILDEYLIWWGYPAVIRAQTQDQKITALQDIIRKIFEKDAGFRFAKDHLLVFEDIVSLFGQQAWHSYKKQQLQEELNISQQVLSKYIDFFEKNHLFYNVPHFWTQKNREISLQKKLYCIDTWLISYLTGTYTSRIKQSHGISNYVFQELLINKRPEDEILTYKKINMSEVDFILKSPDGSLLPITISLRNSPHPPKTMGAFISKYGEKTRGRIKVTPFMYHHKKSEGKDIYTLPRCMVKEIININATL